ncbi:hypothetical protein SMGD1_0278 [Sulfurimonas gotlandica GD1]|uniref:Uncharacterized protein n=1 Tax=Sulfurimonas gotlandica (strain DSM 19862 / JCM 16533 / GD1) TaxID=929558 RepID=H1FTM9_SULGG|nr:hypothetical protein [Sulfurimonas gotlandica]EHP28805.1 hypothetical protein SMGD1_0278 [Sulfurimonas gotlandica GD1]
MYHNDDRKDHLTFNAEDVLNSEIVEGLDPKNFVAGERESW